MRSFSKPVEAIRQAKKLTKDYGTNYYYATKLFPKDIQDAVYSLYGFVRMADEIVDTESKTPEEAKERLERLQHEWHEALQTGTHEDPILAAAAWAFVTYSVPSILMDTFLEAMLRDTYVTRYETYEDLKEYMHGSAAVIGIMLVHIIGTSDHDAYAYAADLGYAMQLTNFLRDIREDYEQRERIYLPKEDMDRFGVTEDMVKGAVLTPELKELLKFEADRARVLYERADKGIPMLSVPGRKAVLLSRVLYSKILDRISEADYDVFSARRSTTTLQKLRYAIPIIFSS